MELHRLVADSETRRDCLVGQSLGQQLEHLLLARRKRFDDAVGMSGGPFKVAPILPALPVRGEQDCFRLPRLDARAASTVANSPTTSIAAGSRSRRRLRSPAEPTITTRISWPDVRRS